MHKDSNAASENNGNSGKAQTPGIDIGYYRIPINVKLNSQSLVQEPSNQFIGKNAAAVGAPNFGTSLFKPISASLSVNSDVFKKSNTSAFEASSTARRKRESKLERKHMLAARFEKLNYLSENNDHVESFNESSSMSLIAGSNNQIQTAL